MKQVTHWKPNSNYFIIAQPMFNGPFKIGENIELKHPRENESMQAEIMDHWTYLISEVPNFLPLLVYGLDVGEMLRIYTDRYDEMTPDTEVKFLLLKKI